MIEEPTAPQKSRTVREHCPTCNAERVCDVHGHTYAPWLWEDKHNDNSIGGGVDHSLLQCRGCETVFYLRDSWSDENLNYWYDSNGEVRAEPVRNKNTYPKPKSVGRPVWLEAIGRIDIKLQAILNEVYIALDNEAYILTAVGLRTALDRGTEVLGIDSTKTFSEKLSELQKGGWIGATEHDILEVITDAGNAAAHRGWSPDAADIGQLLYAMEVFLQRAFIVGKNALNIKSSIPPKPKRQKTPRSN